MTLETPLSSLKGVGPETAKTLAKLKLNTVGDLSNYWPRRYDDYSNVQQIARLKPGVVTIKAKISNVTARYVRRGMHITEALVSDDTGSLRAVWFNQPYRAGQIKQNAEYYLSGSFGLRRERMQLVSPSIELVSDFPTNTARIIPIYKEIKGVKSGFIRKLIKQISPVIKKLPESLPPWLLQEQAMLSRGDAVFSLHFPSSREELDKARERLGFEEVFELSLASLINKAENTKEKALAIPFIESAAKEFVKILPFQLTDAQRKVVWRIYLDMQKDQPMNRLVEGDVGSGKTVVAAMASLMVLQAGFQVAFMSPTELLARQHAESMRSFLSHTKYAAQVALLIGSLKPPQKKLLYERLGSGEIRLIIGTHALIQEKVDMHRLGLIIVDEQHRFGVEQRKKLQAKAGHMPHILHMTATPIPRTLALTLFGELDISVLNAMPHGRKPILTKIWSPNSRKQLNALIDQEIEQGHQVFWVCPLIEDNDDGGAPSVTAMHEQLRTAFLKRKIGMLHGRMKADVKDEVMQEFVHKKLDILVSTTVIEVGVDVPNATVMVIEGADRFGLAQIHQLRGRVGRGQSQGYCYLIPSTSQSPSTRLRALEESSDGFALAELDLKLRGPGAIYGSRQHGLLDLRIAKLDNMLLIKRAREAAVEFLNRGEDMLHYPHLSERVHDLRAVTNLN